MYFYLENKNNKKLKKNGNLEFNLKKVNLKKVVGNFEKVPHYRFLTSIE